MAHDDGFPYVDPNLITELERRFPVKLPVPAGPDMMWAVGEQQGQQNVIQFLKERKRRQEEDLSDVPFKIQT